MKRNILVLFFVAGHITSCLSQTNNDLTVNIITEDIHRFWNSYDLAKPKFKASAFSDYLEKGSQGLKDFFHDNNSKRKLAKAIKSNKENYESIRVASLQIEKKERTKIEKAFKSLKELYPKTFCPDIYFVIGKMDIGSSISDNGILIGYETLSVMGNESLLPLILHEAIHFQQNYSADENGLLGRCIKEGAANLISEIALEQNETFSHNNDEYAFANEKELWNQFVKDMKADKLKNWLYNGKVLGNGPKHMGYWIGYQIVKEYYLKTKDKKQAISDILNIKDFNKFLNRSGYLEKFK